MHECLLSLMLKRSCLSLLSGEEKWKYCRGKVDCPLDACEVF